MTDDELLRRMQEVDPSSRRVPPGLRKVLDELIRDRDAEIASLRAALAAREVEVERFRELADNAAAEVDRERDANFMLRRQIGAREAEVERLLKTYTTPRDRQMRINDLTAEYAKMLIGDSIFHYAIEGSEFSVDYRRIVEIARGLAAAVVEAEQ